MILATAGTALAQPRRPQPAPNNPFVVGVGADGRIVPAGGLIHIAAPAGLQGQAIVGELKVKVGDWVEPGQVLVLLRDHAALQAQLTMAERERDVAKAAVAQAEAGQLRALAELQVQSAELAGRAAAADANARRAAEASRLALESAQREETAAKTAFEAAQQMAPIVHAVAQAGVAVAQAGVDVVGRGRESKIYGSQLDQAKAGQQRAEQEMSAQLAQLQAQAELAGLRVKQAEAALILEPAPDDIAKLAPVQIEARAATQALEAQGKLSLAVAAERGADVAAASARLAAAEAAVDVAKAQLASSELRAPSAGRILAIRARPGELVGPAGVLEMGDTRVIFVDALVYIDDIPGIHVGQKVMVTGSALPVQGLPGSVTDISPMVAGNTLPSIDPTVFSDQTVVLVKIRLDEPGPTANLINAQVVVRFAP